MNIVDWVLLGAVAVFALAGWLRRFVAGLLSFVGFIGGALLAAHFVPGFLDPVAKGAPWRVPALVLIVIVAAVLGQAIASPIGKRLRTLVKWSPVRFIDNIGGAALNVFALAIIAWILASILILVPYPAVAQQIQHSKVLSTLDSLVPDQVRTAFSRLQSVVSSSTLLSAMDGLSHLAGPEVAAPSGKGLDAAVTAARASVVRISGNAPDCGGSVSGTGFVVAPERVMTNAHVVAGVQAPFVEIHIGGQQFVADVVYFDSSQDVAILSVSGLPSTPLGIESQVASTDDSAVVAGFPNGGPFHAVPARIRAQLDLHAQDIYGQGDVTRSVYSLRANIKPGDSGGPLLTPQGLVLGMVFGADVQNDTGYALTTAALTGPIASAPGLSAHVASGSCHIKE